MYNLKKILAIVSMVFLITLQPVAAQDCTGWVSGESFWKNTDVAKVQACLNSGANINARSKLGATPLHYAARYNETPAVVTALLAAGADATVKNKNGKTAFDLFERNNNVNKSHPDYWDIYWRLYDAVHAN